MNCECHVTLVRDLVSTRGALGYEGVKKPTKGSYPLVWGKNNSAPSIFALFSQTASDDDLPASEETWSRA